jgi:hypothetical protein
MAEAKRKPEHKEAETQSGLAPGLEGFEQFFDEQSLPPLDATVLGDVNVKDQIEKLLQRFTELISLSVDQRVETGRIATQLIENQRQLIATQQILIRLMERSIELTRHVTVIEEKLPALFELPRMFESLRVQLEHVENIEID